MDFVMSPADLEKIAGAALRIDPNPARLAGRVLGLGTDEANAGIPTWAWITLAASFGTFSYMAYRTDKKRGR